MIRDEGGEAIAHAADITDASSCATIPTVAMSSFGALDVLHNNVGIGGGDGQTCESRGSWERVMTSISTPCCGRAAVLPVMRAAAGAIVNISSIASVCSTGILVPDVKGRRERPDATPR